MAVARGVHTRVQNAEVRAVEIAADAGEQIVLVGCIHQHLQTFTLRREAGTHDAFVDCRGCALDRCGRRIFRQVSGALRDLAREHARVPGDLVRLVAHEIAHVQCVPQRLVRLVGQGMQGQHGQCFALAAFDHGARVGRTAPECAQRVAVQVFQQLALPGIPYLGAGPSNVGHCQQVQGREVALVPHAFRKGRDHVRIAQVFLLRHAAHGQVFGHQKLDEPAVFTRDAVLAAERAHVARTQFGMVAAASFGDVVEDRRDVEDPRLVPAGCELRAERVFVRVFGDEETAHVAQHHQDVLVHGVDVEQVVLHLADDVAEHPEVAPQHRRLVHQPDGVGDALGLLQDFQEQRAVDRVGTEPRVHHRARVVERAQRAGRQALDAHRGLVEVEGLQDGMRLLHIQVVARHLEHAGLVEEALVERAQAVHAGHVAAQALLDVEQQDLVELRHRLRGPVIALHQRFAGPARAACGARHLRLEAERLGHRGLQVKHQPVLAAVGQQVQACADQAEQGLVGLDLARFQRRGQTLAGQLVPAAAQARGLGHPQDDLQVAQAAGRLLAIRFERVGRVLELGVALAHLQRLGDEEGLGVHGFAEIADQARKGILAAGDQPAFQQRGLHGHVLGRLGHAVANGAHAGADLESQVPAGADERLQPGLERRVRVRQAAIGQQHQNIDIGKRKQFAASVAAHRHQRETGTEVRERPEFTQGLVGQAGKVLQGLAHAAGGGALDTEPGQQGGLVAAVLEPQRAEVAQARGRGGDGHEVRRPRPRPGAPRSRARQGCRRTG
jgi:hypothetical protein